MHMNHECMYLAIITPKGLAITKRTPSYSHIAPFAYSLFVAQPNELRPPARFSPVFWG